MNSDHDIDVTEETPAEALESTSETILDHAAAAAVEAADLSDDDEDVEDEEEGDDGVKAEGDEESEEDDDNEEAACFAAAFCWFGGGGGADAPPRLSVVPHPSVFQDADAHAVFVDVDLDQRFAIDDCALGR
ncbi:hypothetical protein [Mesorhizobium sp. M0047]